MEGWLQWSKKEKVEPNASITDVTKSFIYKGHCGWKEQRLISQVIEVMMKEELEVGANNELYLWYFVSICLIDLSFLVHLTQIIQGFKEINYNAFVLYPCKQI